MALIVSISGIRGTIGGKSGTNLTPIDIVAFTSAYAQWLKKKNPNKIPTVLIGRDARPSGPMVASLVINTLVAAGVNVINLGLSTTPTVEVAVKRHQGDGGIIITASHNPVVWNALKLLNEQGEFISAEEGELLVRMIRDSDYEFAEVKHLGNVTEYNEAIDDHIEELLKRPEIDVVAIRQADFSVAVDAVNSSGGIAIPKLLRALGVKKIKELNCEPTGWFAHNPEPLREHLEDIMQLVKSENCDLGIVVDPDVDRLALIDEKGEMFGEEYTLVAVADYLLSQKSGSTVSNLSSSRALADLTYSYGGQYYTAAVGEVNVVKKMKEVNARIGGEGNGGVIWPDFHFGRDALAGVALILTHLAKSGTKLSELKAKYPSYYMSKNKIELLPGMDTAALLLKIKDRYKNEKIIDVDGIKIDFAESWVHLRRSNTEPIIRIYTEAKSQVEADNLASRFVKELKALV
ncbi:phosphoglucosamine mutase [Schleiferia thermophila]|jgi:phosphomannomutase|uniref:Phosphomannomutase n=1 Tax=Schleiferia thermophila TaxID=884107 RepID=A0A368ZZ89_9FLAO|nr:phosphoglucosamine mutase [Schleiferia thermophila]KFD38094.1 phosphoglucosamine mutase [Schleiferia thermophila str. Yellowstone]RCX02243.1 phosphomannomutase [Schleiferia thermophila]GCD80871.1 phosphoglucosamine mutase [Schleiferia thermophila]